MEYWVVDHKHIFKPEELYLESHASTIEGLSDGTLVAAWFGRKVGAAEKGSRDRGGALLESGSVRCGRPSSALL